MIMPSIHDKSVYNFINTTSILHNIKLNLHPLVNYAFDNRTPNIRKQVC